MLGKNVNYFLGVGCGEFLSFMLGMQILLSLNNLHNNYQCCDLNLSLFFKDQSYVMEVRLLHPVYPCV